MRIVCPSCSVAYDVPPERLAPGRKVRCAGCGDAWAPDLGASAEQEPVEVPAERPPVEAPAERPPVEAPAERPPVEAPGERPPAEVPGEPHPVEAPPPEVSVLQPGTVDAPARSAGMPPLSAGAPAAVISLPPPPPFNTGAMALAGWALTLVVLAVATWTAVVRRDAIMHAWPNSQRAYAAIGLHQ